MIKGLYINQDIEVGSSKESSIAKTLDSLHSSSEYRSLIALAQFAINPKKSNRKSFMNLLSEEVSCDYQMFKYTKKADTETVLDQFVSRFQDPYNICLVYLEYQSGSWSLRFDNSGDMNPWHIYITIKKNEIARIWIKNTQPLCCSLGDFMSHNDLDGHHGLKAIVSNPGMGKTSFGKSICQWYESQESRATLWNTRNMTIDALIKQLDTYLQLGYDSFSECECVILDNMHLLEINPKKGMSRVNQRAEMYSKLDEYAKEHGILLLALMNGSNKGRSKYNKCLSYQYDGHIKSYFIGVLSIPQNVAVEEDILGVDLTGSYRIDTIDTEYYIK